MKRYVHLLKRSEKISFKFIPPKTILCDNRDPLWNSNKMKKLINKKNTAYQSFIQNGKSAESFQFFRTFKVCYYLQLKLPNNNVTRRFLKN